MNVVRLSGRFKMNVSLERDENSHCEVAIFIVRLAAHVSQGCKSQVCPVVGKT